MGEDREDSSFISRVSGSVEIKEDLNSSADKEQRNQNAIVWELPKSIDKEDRKIIQTGECEILNSSQKTICDLMHKIKIKGARRPTKMSAT